MISPNSALTAWTSSMSNSIFDFHPFATLARVLLCVQITSFSRAKLYLSIDFHHIEGIYYNVNYIYNIRIIYNVANFLLLEFSKKNLHSLYVYRNTAHRKPPQKSPIDPMSLSDER